MTMHYYRRKRHFILFFFFNVDGSNSARLDRCHNKCLLKLLSTPSSIMCISVKAGVRIWIWGKSQQRSACPLFQVQSSPISWNAQVMPGLAPPWPTMVGYEAKQLCKLWFVRLWRRRGRTILDQHPAQRIKYRVLCFSKKCWINTKTWDVSGTKRNRFLGKTGKGSTNSKSWINHCDRLNNIFLMKLSCFW